MDEFGTFVSVELTELSEGPDKRTPILVEPNF